MCGFLGCFPEDIRNMPSDDYAAFVAYSRIEPFGIRRHDWHHAKTQAIITNSVNAVMYGMGMTKSKRTVTPADFTYPRKKTQQQKLNVLKSALNLMARGKEQSE